jgi:hypothetical protein
MDRENYTDYVDSNGNTHQILTGIYPKQCDAYCEAQEKDDYFAMRYLELPYLVKPMYLIQHELEIIEMNCLVDRC